MTDDNTSGTPEGGSESGSTQPPNSSTGTFSQEDMDRTAAARAAQGKRAGKAELLQELGLSSTDELKTLLDAARNKDEADLSEAQKIMRAAEEKERKANERVSQADSVLLNARIERALEAAGVPVATSPKVRRLVEGLETESSVDEINAAVAALKADMPTVFMPGETPPPPPPGDAPPPANSDPGKPPAGNAPAADSAQKAKDLLHSRHPNLTPSQ